MNPTKNLKNLRESWRGFATLVLCVLALLLVQGTTLAAKLEASERPTEANNVTDSNEYRLAPGDKLTVTVFDQPQLSGAFTIGGTGEILLPLAGTAKIAGLTLAETQQLIQERFADGILVQPVVSIRVAEYRPIFVTGYVRKPGNYPFIIGASIKTAIAVAGGTGEPGEQSTGSMSEAIMAKERVRQMETNRLALLVHKARLEAQRDDAADFVMPQLVGFDASDAEFRSLYSAEDNTFLRLVATYQSELKVLQQQRPRIEDEIHAVTDQIAQERDRLNIVSQRIDEYQDLASKGLVRKPELTEQQIEKSLVQAEVSRLQGEIAHLRQNAGDLEIKQEEVKANYKRQVLSELQETSQHLLDIDATLGTARQLRNLKEQKVGFGEEEPEFTVLITRAAQSGSVTFNATDDTKLEPGDVIEVKSNRRDQTDSPDSPATEAALGAQKAPAQQGPVPIKQQHTLLVPAADSAADEKQSSAPANVEATEGQHATSLEGNEQQPSALANVEATEGQHATSLEGNEQQPSAPANVEATEGQHATLVSDARPAGTDLAPHAIMPGSLPPAADVGHVPLPTRHPSSETSFNAIALEGKSKKVDVKAIQQALLSNGYSLTVDGKIGPVTLSAIEDALAGVKDKSAAPNLLASDLQQ